MRDFHQCCVRAEIYFKMKRRLAIIFLISIIGLPLFAQEQQQRSRSAVRRAYPGGRDDSDLTVQTLRQVSKKEGEADHENYEPVGLEYDASSSDAGFGE
ncbi:MAG: hypothetical protein SGI74_01995 [Oligoflexia bacterium]|nr:hypothetical protein [Oligoflexia bacterium]